jgi:hypothetical protein
MTTALTTKRLGTAVASSLLAVWIVHPAPAAWQGAAPAAADLSVLKALGPDKSIQESDCTAARLGASIPASAIGEPVSAVVVQATRWVAAAGPVVDKAAEELASRGAAVVATLRRVRIGKGTAKIRVQGGTGRHA